MTAAAGARSRNGPMVWFVLPALVMFTAFGLIPLAGVLVLSFTRWDGIGAIMPAGFETRIDCFERPIGP